MSLPCLRCFVVILSKQATFLVACAPLLTKQPVSHRWECVFILPLPFVSVPLDCSFLYSSVKWSTRSLNLSAVCDQLVFDISFIW